MSRPGIEFAIHRARAVKKAVESQTMCRGLMLRFVMGVVFLCCSLPVSAQVYCWLDAQTGAKRLSNIPPAWYKNPDPRTSPRVQVFDNGRLIDDTGLSVDQRAELRADSPLSRFLAPLALPQTNPPGRRPG